VLLTLDTTRADRIGAYGYAGARTPTLDGLAAAGGRFTRAYATVPLTTPAHASILTGLYPTRHGVHGNGDAILPDALTTLAEYLPDHQSAASVSAFVTTRVWNLDQGFDAYFDRTHHSSARPGNRWMQERPAEEVVDDAIGWLNGVDERPFLLWAHFYDPHKPYAAPTEFAEAMPRRPYDAEIAYMDAQIGRLKATVDAMGRSEGVIWVALGDHGEALSGEHGETDHGIFIFDPTMHIPLIIRPATPLSAGRVVTTPVSQVDLVPTLLEMAGRPAPTDIDGVSRAAELSGELSGGEETSVPVYMESYTVQQRFGYHPELAVVEGPLKLMDTPSPRLFDVIADPGEARDLSAERPDDVARMREALAEIRGRGESAEGGPVAPELIEQLAALGYVTMEGASDEGWSDLDAKDHLDTIRALEEARGLSMKPDTAEEAVRRYEEIIAREPQLNEARMGLAQVLRARGELPRAEEILREAIAAKPSSTVLRMNLAPILMAQNRAGEAIDLIGTVLDQVPGDRSAQQSMIRMLAIDGRSQAALEQARAWLEEDPTNAAMSAHVGLLMMHGEQLDGAEPHLNASLADDVPRPGVYSALARIATYHDDLDATETYITAELDRFPSSRDARWALGNLHMTRENWPEAAAEYAYLAQTGPRDFGARRSWAQAIFNTGDYELATEILAPALAGTPDDPEVLLLHANLLAKAGRMDEARAVFEEGKRLKMAGPR